MGLFNKIYEGKYTNSFENSIDIAYKTFTTISYVNWEQISGFVDLQPILLTNAIPPTDHLFNHFIINFFLGGLELEDCFFATFIILVKDSVTNFLPQFFYFDKLTHLCPD